MNFRQFFMIYISTLQKELRSKMLLITLILTVVAIIGGGLLYKHYAAEQPLLFEIAKDLPIKAFFIFLLGWSSFLNIIFSIGCVRSDLQDRTLGQILSFPIKRYQYLLARMLGVISIVFCYNCLVLVLGAVVFGPKEVPPSDILLSLLTGLPFSVSLTMWGIFFSLYFNQVISFVFVYLVGLLLLWSDMVVAEAQKFTQAQGMDFWSIVGHIVYWCFPHDPAWKAVSNNILMGKELGLDLGMEIGHYLLTATLLFGILTWIFGRREI